jgi:hypothetical protein
MQYANRTTNLNDKSSDSGGTHHETAALRPNHDNRSHGGERALLPLRVRQYDELELGLQSRSQDRQQRIVVHDSAASLAVADEEQHDVASRGQRAREQALQHRRVHLSDRPRAAGDGRAVRASVICLLPVRQVHDIRSHDAPHAQSVEIDDLSLLHERPHELRTTRSTTTAIGNVPVGRDTRNSMRRWGGGAEEGRGGRELQS